MTKTASPHSFTGFTAIVALIAGAVLTCGATSAHAQSVKPSPPNFVALGVAVVPEFGGPSDHGTVPALIGSLSIGATSLRLLGNSAQWNLMPATSSWAFGPVLALSSARDDDVMKHLRPIDSSASAGAFGEYGWQGIVNSGDNFVAGV
jgi:hypothetical protein